MAASFKRDTALGIVFFLGIFVLLWATAQLGSLSLSEKQNLEVHVPNARGLKVGDNVEYLGTKIGVVSKVDTGGEDLKNPVRLFLRLDRVVTLREKYKIKVADSSLLGGKVVSIEPGTQGAELDLTQQKLLGVAPANPFEALGNLLGGEQNSRNLARILEDIAAITGELREGKGSIGDMLGSAQKFFSSADTLAVDLNTAVNEARKGEGEIGKVITGASSFFATAEEAVDEIRKGKGLAARLINDEKLANDVSDTVASLRTVAKDLEDGKGAVGKLLRDEKLEAQLDSIVTGVDRAVKSVNEGDGLVNALLNDGEITKKVAGIVDNVDALASDLRKGKGTLGRLFTDDTIANQIESLLNQISRTVEDAREAAPVATFVQIFTGVFQ